MMFKIFDVAMVMSESLEKSSNKNKMVRYEVFKYTYLRQLIFLRILQDLIIMGVKITRMEYLQEKHGKTTH